MRILRKTIVVTLVIVAFTLFFAFIALDSYYYRSRPREPHPESGQIYRERVKGTTGLADVCLTRLEKLPYDYADWILDAYGALFVTAWLLNQQWKVIRDPGEGLPKKVS
jgi:hypothetical protein